MKTVIEMAREAGFYDGEIGRAEDAFERFAELVRADFLDWLADQHRAQCGEERPIQEWIRKMKEMK